MSDQRWRGEFLHQREFDWGRHRIHTYDVNVASTVCRCSDEANIMAVVTVISNDLSRGVDAEGSGSTAARGINGREDAVVVEETVLAAAVTVRSDDLSGGVNADGYGRATAWDINGREHAAVVDETVLM